MRLVAGGCERACVLARVRGRLTLCALRIAMEDQQLTVSRTVRRGNEWACRRD